MTKKTLLTATAFSLIVSGLPGSVVAEESGSLLLEEVVVTAQKRAQSAQKVGISITTLTGKQLEKLGMNTSVDIAAQAPNLNIKQAFANSVPQIFMRGVGINDANANASGAVGIYVDEVSLVSPMALTFQLFDTERVEVLRGPQGTLYGRNTTGGAVNFVSRKPTEEFEGYARAGYGNNGAYKLEGAISGPISDTLAARIAFTVNQDDGFHSNRVTGNNDLGDTSAWAVRGLVSWKPSENVDILLNVHGGKTRSSSVPFEFQGLVDPATFGACDPTVRTDCTDYFGYTDSDNDPYAHDIDLEGRTELDGFGASLRADIQINDEILLTSISSYEDNDRFHFEDADAGPLAQVHTLFDDSNEQFSQELRLTGTTEDVNWIVGGFYSEEETWINNEYDFWGGLRAGAEAEGFPGGFDPDGANSVGFPIMKVDQVFTQNSDSIAAFAHVEWKFADQWNLTIGGRYTSERRSMQQATVFEEPTFTIPIVGDTTNKTSFDEFSGKIGLDYEMTDNTLFFGSISRGFKSGGFNGSLVFDAGSLTPFDAETLTSYEIGMKSEFANGLARFNVTAFYYDYKDQQLFTFKTVNGAVVQVLDNAGKSRIAGLEAELLARPFEGLDISAGVGILDTKLQEYISDDGTDLSGNELVMAPDFTANFLARYEWQPGDMTGMASVQVDFSYQSDIFLSTSNAPLLGQGGYMLTNARVAYAGEGDRWEFALWVKNIGNKDYKTEVFDFSDFGYNLQIFGRPRTYGAEFLINF